MRAQGGPQKLRFTIVTFSGEDPDYPVRELLFHSPQTRGWQTPRYATGQGPPHWSEGVTYVVNYWVGATFARAHQAELEVPPAMGLVGVR